jgi:hypothetical protein
MFVLYSCMISIGFVLVLLKVQLVKTIYTLFFNKRSVFEQILNQSLEDLACSLDKY